MKHTTLHVFCSLPHLASYLEPTLVPPWLSERFWMFVSVCAPCWCCAPAASLTPALNSPAGPALVSPHSSATALRSCPALPWSSPCYFSPIFLLNLLFPFLGLPVLTASFWISVKKPKSKNVKLWPALEQWLSSFVMQGDLFLKREASFLNMKFPEL